jgi:DNA-binding beta-propeller fold protein YncE
MAGRTLGTTLGGVAAAWLLAGCAGCGQDDRLEVHPVWPSPPAAPRISHVKNIRGAEQMGKASVLDGLGRLITGAPRLSLLRPHGVAVEPGKHLYVTDQERQAVAVLSFGSSKAHWITDAGGTFFVSPVGVAACGDVLAVADSVLKNVFVLTPAGKLVRVIEKPGGYRRPTGLAYDAKRGLLYVVDTLANEVCAFELSSGKLIQRFGTHGEGPGRFNYPTHICVGPRGRIYVTDSLNFRVQVFTPSGRYEFHIGKLGDASGHLAVPKGVGVDRHGHIYIVDSYFSTVQTFDQQGRLLLSIGGPGEQAGLFQVPTGLCVDAENRIYICDSYNRRVQLLQYVGGPPDEDSPQKP